jgi:colanic acid biosynthesis glycosyl transferase WcaI
VSAARRLRIELLGLNYAPEPTGIAPYTTGIARFLADAGHDVRVVTGFPHYPEWKRSGLYRGRRVDERDGDIRVTRIWHPVPQYPAGAGRIGMEAAFAASAATVRLGAAPDVVVAVSPALLTVGAALRRAAATGAAVGVVVQDLYGRALAETGLLGGRAAAASARLESGLLRRADGVVAIHDSFRRSLATLGVAPERITTIRNWSHIDHHHGDTYSLRQALGWRDDEIVALHAGNMGAKQGLGTVVEAARLAELHGLPVRVVLLGTGHQRSHLEALGRGVSTLQFLDPLPRGDFETALAAADVLVLNEQPGITEMCVPSKLTSYFTAGRPVVAATSPRSAATSEIAASGAGAAVAPGDPAGLLDAILLLAGNETEALAMGLRGQLFARDVLSAEAARSRYVSWVEGLAGAQPSTPAWDGPRSLAARRALRARRPRRASDVPAAHAPLIEDAL